MRVIFAGGGTGGHLFPGLAVARELQQRDSMTEILFVGTEQGIEARVLPREGFRLETIPVRGLKGRGIRGLLDAAWGIPSWSLSFTNDHSKLSAGRYHRSRRLCLGTRITRREIAPASLRDHGAESPTRLYQ